AETELHPLGDAGLKVGDDHFEISSWAASRAKFSSVSRSWSCWRSLANSRYRAVTSAVVGFQSDGLSNTERH
ncbi:MAG: hypothetical protein ACM31G_08065, partial [Flavobacteriales bacterium]